MSRHAMDTYGQVTDRNTVRISRVLPGPIERVWRYLTEPELRSLWLAGGDMELRPSGRVEHVFRNSDLSNEGDAPPPKYAKQAGEARMQGHIVECDPPVLLRYTWGEESGEPSEVCFELTPQAGEVLLVVTHRLLRSREVMTSVAAGWHTHLDILVARLTDREPASFWATHTQLEAEYDRRIPRD